jgi:hypothetical protein
MANGRTTIWSLGLLLSLLLPYLGTGGWLQWRRHQLKEAVKVQLLEGLPAAELVHFTFLPDELDQLAWEHEREFVYQDQWFDVVRQETRGDTLHLWCWLDQAETALERQLSQLVDRALGHDEQGQDRRVRLLQFGQTLFCQPPLLPLLRPPISPDQPLFFHQAPVLTRLPGPPPYPPPRPVVP